MEFISVENLIKILREKNIDFGKGDPYNRLRYYTKIGWIPHMTRKKKEDGIIMGHYPSDIIDKIISIENLKKLGKSNDEIKSIINRNSSQNTNIIKLLDKIKSININLILVLVVIIGVVYELSKNNSHSEIQNIQLNQKQQEILPEKRIIDSGISFIPKQQNKIFIPTSNVTSTSIILLNFYTNIGYGNNYTINEIKDTQGFFVETSYSVPQDSKFNWIIIR